MAEDGIDSITESLENYARPSSMNDKTVSELMNEQTEAIKKIMSAHKSEAESPIVPDKEPVSQNMNDYEESIIKEELGPLEDVKAKCEYYFKISNSRQKDADKRNDISKQTITASASPYLYASGYVNRPTPPIYEATQFNTQPTVESSVIASNGGIIKEETDQKRYYQYVPYQSNTKLNNINVKYVPYFYGSNYGIQTSQLSESTQAGSEFNSNQKVASVDSVAKVGIVKEESSQNKFYEYVPNKNRNTANIQYLQPLSYASQPVSLPVYIENQVTAKPIAEPPTSETNIKEQISNAQFYQYVPYNFYQNPAHNIPVVQQNENIPKEYSSVSNIKYQISQTSSGHEADSNQQLIQNQESKYPKIAPLTLQNALVSDGRTLYYWYKSVPGYQVYVNVPYSANIPDPEPIPPINQGYNYQSNIKYTYITQPPKVPESTTAAPTTTTTEIVPSFEVKYSTNEASSKDLLKHQLKFVYPVPYSDTVNYNPKQIDPYAYYPKALQPSTVNFRLPYVPTFHLIKALDIPSKYAEPAKLQPEVTTKK